MDPRLGADQEFIIESFDNNFAGTYTLTVSAWFIDYDTNIADKDFTVVIQENCETAMVVTPRAKINDEEYTVARTAVTTGAFAEFGAAPAHCFISGYTFTVTPVLLAPDDVAIQYNGATRDFTIETANILIVGAYNVFVTALTPKGADTATGFTWVATIKSPCGDATLTINPDIILPTPY